VEIDAGDQSRMGGDSMTRVTQSDDSPDPVSDVDAMIDRLGTFLAAGAPREVENMQRRAARAAQPHDYDELIDALIVFLGALIRARARDICGTDVAARSPTVVQPARAPDAPRRRQHSPETRAKMAAAARERYAREREQKARAGR
jgi:hypothetical protein